MSADNPRRTLTLSDVLAEKARSVRDRTAMVCGDVRLTWREFDARVSRVAAVLSGNGVTSGGGVLWLGQNCHRMLEVLFACSRLGAVLCPVNWRNSVDELAFVMQDVEPAVVLWQETEIGDNARKVRELSSSIPATWIQIDGPDGDGEYEQLLASADVPAEWPEGDAGEPVIMIYTAAHDGRPNGALLSSRAWVYQNLVTAIAQRTSAEDTFLCSGPLFHVGTLRHTLSIMQLGGCNVIVRRVDAEELCRLIAEEHCTMAFLERPTMEQMVALNADGRYDLKSLRNPPVFPEWDAMVTVEVRPLRNGFGQTELAGVVTFAENNTPGIGGAGRPSPIAVVDVVDPDGIPVGVGEVGEMVVRGPMVMNGYHRRPEVNAERQRGGWHHTTDLARKETDGTITFVGPATRIVKSASENIYPAEVEGCLKAHAAVAGAAVIGTPDPQWTQSVLAVVVLAPGASVTADELIEHCRQRIASYKKPKRIEFIDALPRTPGGAVDYDALDERYGGGGYPSR